MNNKMKAMLVGTSVATLLGAGVAAAAAGVDTVAKTTSVVDMPSGAVSSDDAPGHVSGKNRATGDDAPGHVSGKNRATSDDTAADADHSDAHVSGNGTDSSDDTDADHDDADVSGNGTDSSDD